MSQEKISVSVTIDDKKITLEGPEDFVKSEVQRITGMIASRGQRELPLVSSSKEIDTDTAFNEQSLIEEKQPKGHHEIVAVLAFYLAGQGQEEFTEDDIRRAYIRARVRPPKVVGQALRDAKNKYEYIEKGSGRGTYRLTHHGDRTVRFDLPRDK